MKQQFILRFYDSKAGVVKQVPDEYHVDSWVKAMAQIMVSEADPLTDVTGLIDTSNVSRALGVFPSFKLQLVTAAGDLGDDTRGIVVGTGITALDRDDHALTTQIAEGTGSGQFTHQTDIVQAGVPVTGGGGYDVICSRTFDNNSGAKITIQETGMYVKGDSFLFMIAHDLVSGGHDVENGDSVVVEYIIRFNI